MPQLFKRVARITVGTTQVTGLAMKFEIKKSLKKQANTCIVRIANLSQTTRKSLEAEKTLPCKVEAGYDGELHQLFAGTVRRGSSIVNGTEIVTTVSSGDSDVQLTAQRLALTIPKAATPQEVLAAAAKLLEVAPGNVGTTVSETNWSPTSATQFHGNAADAMTHITRGMGLEWSVQDGAMLVLPIGQPVQGARLVALSATTGLVGSPSIDNKGVMHARALIQPDLLPGYGVQIDAIGVKGTFRIEEVTFTGDTRGTDWYADIAARRF